MENIPIREAREDDAARIVQIYREAGIGPDQSFTPQEARAQLETFRRYPSLRVFVAEIEGEIAGACELLLMDNLAKRGQKSAIVEDVAVSPKHQGRGVGRALVQHVMQLAKDAGCYKLVLSSNLNRPDAHAFYQSLGFQTHGYSFRVDFR